MEEFEKLLAESYQSDMVPGEAAPAEESLPLPLTTADDSSVENDSTETAPDTDGAAEVAEAAECENAREETEAPSDTRPEY